MKDTKIRRRVSRSRKLIRYGNVVKLMMKVASVKVLYIMVLLSLQSTIAQLMASTLCGNGKHMKYFQMDMKTSNARMFSLTYLLIQIQNRRNSASVNQSRRLLRVIVVMMAKIVCVMVLSTT